MKIPSFSISFAVILLAGTAFGQAPEAADQSALIRQMMQRIDELEKRVNELEAEKGVKPAVPPLPVVPEISPPVETATTEKPPAVATPMPGMPGMSHPQSEVSGPVNEATYPSLHIAGFSDIDFSATDQKGSNSGFSEGQFILHLTSVLSPRVNYFAEISMTARTDAGTGSPPAPGFNLEVERSIIRFEENDHLKVSFGRYHTPINYWNYTFHHGSWLQTTIDRPEMVKFGGSFLPVHFVGALAEGAFTLGGLNLHYDSGIGNGRSSVISRDGDFGDVNNARSWLFNVYSQPDRFYGLQVGASLYRDKINPLVGDPSREWIESAHIVWQKENPEVIAEFANVTHNTIGSPGVPAGLQFNSQAWYVQAAYRLPIWDHLWKPYYRFEYIHIPRGDTIFALVPDLAGSTAGVRYDIASFVALKFEYRNDRRPGIPRVNGLFGQTSFTF